MPAPQPLTSRCTPTRSQFAVVLDAALLSQALFALLSRDPGDAVLDVSGVTFLGAAGLGVVARWAGHQRSRADVLDVRGASGRTRAVFALVGLEHLVRSSAVQPPRRLRLVGPSTVR